MSKKVLDLTGAAEIKELFEKLPDKLAKSIERKAIKKIGEQVKQEVINRVPVDDGALRSSIELKVRRKKGEVTAQITAGDDTAWYAHLVEYGFVHTGHKRKAVNGKKVSGTQKPTSRGFVSGKKFMRGAIASQSQEIVDTLTRTLQEMLEEAVKKQG